MTSVRDAIIDVKSHDDVGTRVVLAVAEILPSPPAPIPVPHDAVPDFGAVSSCVLHHPPHPYIFAVVAGRQLEPIAPLETLNWLFREQCLNCLPPNTCPFGRLQTLPVRHSKRISLKIVQLISDAINKRTRIRSQSVLFSKDLSFKLSSQSHSTILFLWLNLSTSLSLTISILLKIFSFSYTDLSLSIMLFFPFLIFSQPIYVCLFFTFVILVILPIPNRILPYLPLQSFGIRSRYLSRSFKLSLALFCSQKRLFHLTNLVFKMSCFLICCLNG